MLLGHCTPLRQRHAPPPARRPLLHLLLPSSCSIFTAASAWHGTAVLDQLPLHAAQRDQERRRLQSRVPRQSLPPRLVPSRPQSTAVCRIKTVSTHLAEDVTPDTPMAVRIDDRWKQLSRLTRMQPPCQAADASASTDASAAVVHVPGGRFMDRQDLSCAVRTLTCLRPTGLK
jgi:hypothetical protein